ncbi:MAG: CRISPR-associated protein Cas4 [Candidatus Sericytochromatia bacterium]|nr:CRISPR-associated protein Cas4 [Candidatus Sericytochromatia bacterium]
MIFPEWQDEDWITVSALQHTAYCPRQCALIHVEKVFDENIYTLRGHRLHEKVDIPETENRDGVRFERALSLVCQRLGLYGKADMVEFNALNIPYPVEYKHGSRKSKTCDDIQLCAQALCLEEMMNCQVSEGALYYFSSKKRRLVFFTPELRKLTEDTVITTRKILQETKIPPPVNDERCPDCSLIERCLPQMVSHFQEVRDMDYLFLPLKESRGNF